MLLASPWHGLVRMQSPSVLARKVCKPLYATIANWHLFEYINTIGNKGASMSLQRINRAVPQEVAIAITDAEGAAMRARLSRCFAIGG